MNYKDLRKKNGFTQIDVALKVGVSLTTYQLWERGVSNPTPENLAKLKVVFGIEV